ncbi:MAG: PHP domain-containing protein, partial [Victivallales bacterium]|nr:PHP domain-containing protein [Victivallales bacterium]
ELCKGSGIVQGNFSYHLLAKADVSREELLGELRKFHVITVRPFGEGADKLGQDSEGKAAATVGGALAEYVNGGGSVIIMPRLSRYTNTKDMVFWNRVLSPFGMAMDNNHGIAGAENVRLEEKPAWFNYFFRTSVIEAHEATAGVRNLWFPVNSYSNFPGTPRVEYGKEWRPLAFAEAGAGVWECMEYARIRFNGKNRVEPVDGRLPLVAIRKFGDGHVACIQADPIYLGMNYGNVFWAHTVESKGDGKVPSDMMLLFMNLVKFMGRDGLKHAELGGYEPSAERPVEFPAAVYWDDFKYGGYDGEPAMGVFGAHTSYSDGASTVAEYVAAAKKAGLSFIVFADDVKLMDNSKTEALKADCKAASDDGFLALPGLEFQDSTGLHRYVYGSNIKFPYEKPYMHGGRAYPIMKEGRIDQAGYFIYGMCSASQNLFLDSSEFGKCDTHPENLWWFWSFAPWYFDGRTLVMDNRAQGRAFLHDLRLICPVSFTRILKADDVQAAKETSMTGGRSLKQIAKLLNNRSSSYWAAKDAREFVTRGNTGIRIVELQGINEQEEPMRLHTRGTQRARVHFNVRSPAGLKEIRVMDADAGVFRRFKCGGIKEFSQTVEFVHDRQHHLFLEAEDNDGGEAISTII